MKKLLKPLCLIVLCICGGMYLRPAIEDRIPGDKNSLNKDAVFLADRLLLSKTYTLKNGSEVEVKKRYSGELYSYVLNIYLDDDTCLVSKGWDFWPSGDAKYLGGVKIGEKLFRKSYFSSEEFKSLSHEYQTIIKEVAVIERDAVETERKNHEAKLKNIESKVKGFVSKVKERS